MDYELAWNSVCAGQTDFTNIELVGILTGLSYEEIELAAPLKPTWNGQAFVKTFTKLGFNTSERFCKFDPETRKPCLMRATWYQKGYWSAWIYDGKLVNNMWTLEEWQKKYHKLKITSMLQVWI